ncbi:MAG: hypothetical protein LBT84_07980 [Spirochaetia bacterium]|jgi:hypothetical protein|nr:hypothetical protein [Spirochaetia bacterium]
MKNIVALFTKPLLAVFAAAAMAGCATVLPYSFAGAGQETASIDFMVTFLHYENIRPEVTDANAKEKTILWNPVSFPAGKELNITVHVAYLEQKQQGTGVVGGILASLANSAAESRKVDTDVSFVCPALKPGAKYILGFIKGGGNPGTNTLVLRETQTKGIIFQQDFSVTGELIKTAIPAPANGASTAEGVNFKEQQAKENFVPQFRQYSGGRPGQNEAVLKISCDSVFFWIYPDVYFWLDDYPVTFRAGKDEISFIIPNGRHKIRATIWGDAQDWSKNSKFFKEAEFTANSNLLSVVYDVGWVISYGADLKVEEKK